MPAPPARWPSIPRRPTTAERVAGIRADLERIRSETVDLDTATDLAGVIALVDNLTHAVFELDAAA